MGTMKGTGVAGMLKAQTEMQDAFSRLMGIGGESDSVGMPT